HQGTPTLRQDRHAPIPAGRAEARTSQGSTDSIGAARIRRSLGEGGARAHTEGREERRTTTRASKAFDCADHPVSAAPPEGEEEEVEAKSVSGLRVQQALRLSSVQQKTLRCGSSPCPLQVKPEAAAAAWRCGTHGRAEGRYHGWQAFLAGFQLADPGMRPRLGKRNSPGFRAADRM